MSACFYCGANVTKDSDREFDHFPVPRAAASKQTVLACRRCRFLKDRAATSVLSARVDECLDTAPEYVVFLQHLFLGAADDNCAEVARRTLAQIWGAFPPVLRLANARILATLYLNNTSYVQ